MVALHLAAKSRPPFPCAQSTRSAEHSAYSQIQCVTSRVCSASTAKVSEQNSATEMDTYVRSKLKWKIKRMGIHV